MCSSCYTTKSGNNWNVGDDLDLRGNQGKINVVVETKRKRLDTEHIIRDFGYVLMQTDGSGQITDSTPKGIN